VDESLGNPENKAMKLLISTFFTLLLIGFAGGSYGQPDFEETKLLAEQGNAFAQHNLGLMYADGEGVPENDVEAGIELVCGGRGRSRTHQACH
jgi:hypothetical protein